MEDRPNSRWLMPGVKHSCVWARTWLRQRLSYFLVSLLCLCFDDGCSWEGFVPDLWYCFSMADNIFVRQHIHHIHLAGSGSHSLTGWQGQLAFLQNLICVPGFVTYTCGHTEVSLDCEVFIRFEVWEVRFYSWCFFCGIPNLTLKGRRAVL